METTEFQTEEGRNRFIELLFIKECNKKPRCDNSELCTICKEERR